MTPDETLYSRNQSELAKALRVLAHSLPLAESRVRAAAAAWSPERAAGFRALLGTLDLLRDEHRRISDELDRADFIRSE